LARVGSRWQFADIPRTFRGPTRGGPIERLSGLGLRLTSLPAHKSQARDESDHGDNHCDRDDGNHPTSVAPRRALVKPTAKN